MSSYNKVIIMGNLTRDPEVRFSQSGSAVCSLSVAVNERYKDKSDQWVDRATYVDVTIFGKRGEAFSKYHKKGDACFLEGKLRLDQWEDKQNGAKRSKLFVVADQWEFVGGKGGAAKTTQSEPDPWANQTPTGDGETPF